MGNRYEQMTDEELKELAKFKDKQTGCAQKKASFAQAELWRRHHWDTPKSDPVEIGYTERSIEDLQYNGC